MNSDLEPVLLIVKLFIFGVLAPEENIDDDEFCDDGVKGGGED